MYQLYIPMFIQRYEPKIARLGLRFAWIRLVTYRCEHKNVVEVSRPYPNLHSTIVIPKAQPLLTPSGLR